MLLAIVSLLVALRNSGTVTRLLMALKRLGVRLDIPWLRLLKTLQLSPALYGGLTVGANVRMQGRTLASDRLRPLH